MLSTKVQFARDYAIEKHADQKYGEHPYSFHLDAVYEITLEIGLGEDYQIAAYLHDVLEDTTTTREDMQKIFGEHITNMVYAVSGFGASRSERQADMKRKINEYPAAIDLKMADRLANLRSSQINKPSLFKTYCKEHEILKELFKKGSIQLFKQIEEVVYAQILPTPTMKLR